MKRTFRLLWTGNRTGREYLHPSRFQTLQAARKFALKIIRPNGVQLPIASIRITEDGIPVDNVELRPVKMETI